MPEISVLPKKPLIEAILEFRWQIPQETGDPNYSLLVGSLFDRIKNKYPFHESLASTLIPPYMAENFVQHRFRVEKGGWPLVQIGPGIITLNDTDHYVWPDFGDRARFLINTIYAAYPESEQLKVNNLVLRYLDAFELAEGENPLNYLSNKLKTNVSFSPQLFNNPAVSPNPKVFNVTASFQTNQPNGSILIKFANGKSKEKPALIMESAVQSDASKLPKMPEGFDQWIEDAHKLNHDWFFKLIEGELLRSFSGE